MEGADEALISELRALGVEEERISKAKEQGRLAVLPIELALEDEGSRTLREVAESEGVDVESLIATRRALGLPIDEEGAVYGSALEEHAKRLRAALDAGVPLEALIAINRTVGRSTLAVADASREVIASIYFEELDLEDPMVAFRTAEAARALLPVLGKVLTYALEEHVRELVRSQAGLALGGALSSDPGDVAIAFADLVGFTQLSEEVGAVDLGGAVERLEAHAFDSLRPGVSVVKLIGDEVMLAGADADDLTASVLELLRLAGRDEALPDLRAGAAFGPAIHRAGDWYGRVVNLASRLAGVAEPGTLAVDGRLRELVDRDRTWQSIGNVELKGFGETVPSYVAMPER